MKKIIYEGWIEVICGPMFSGKTEELLKRLDKIKYARAKSVVFKPKKDTRSQDKIVSRWNNYTNAIEIKEANEILAYLENSEEKYRVIAIDEAQFLDESIISVVSELAKRKYHIILAGLDKNYRGEPFGYMPQLLAISDKATKLSALCAKCESVATFTKRIKSSRKEFLIGDVEFYEARCYDHFYNDHNKNNSN